MKNSNRRDFIKLNAMGFAGIALQFLKNLARLQLSGVIWAE